jgi:hypothetical protein
MAEVAAMAGELPAERVGENLVDQMRLNVSEAVRAARATGMSGIRTVATAQLRELSDRLFALKETMPDESFRQLSDSLMTAHNAVVA